MGAAFQAGQLESGVCLCGVRSACVCVGLGRRRLVVCGESGGAAACEIAPQDREVAAVVRVEGREGGGRCGKASEVAGFAASCAAARAVRGQGGKRPGPYAASAVSSQGGTWPGHP
eukprot:60853-Chlamydomonas_euryale.AAC.1